MSESFSISSSENTPKAAPKSLGALDVSKIAHKKASHSESAEPAHQAAAAAPAAPYSVAVGKNGVFEPSRNAFQRKCYSMVMRSLMYLCTGLTVSLVFFLIGYILFSSIPHFSWDILTTKPSYIRKTIGVLPDILNTVYIIIAAVVMVLPLGVGAAIYLNEYATSRRLVGAIEYAIETLAFDYLRLGRYAHLLPVLWFADFAHCWCFNLNHHDPANHYPYHPRELKDGTSRLP